MCTAARASESMRMTRKRSQELNWGFGAFSGDALVPGLTIGSGKQETARAATGTAARQEAGTFWSSAVILVCLSRYMTRFLVKFQAVCQ